MATPRKHIEEIRRKKFSIGVSEENPLNEDLHHAVRHLSVELYSKDIHFLMEIIQNAEDNEYPDDEVPTLEFVITSKDITGVGASATLLVFNNEKGFSKQNIESLCSVGRSTKKGKRNSGYIGEKGIGFKSVFLISKHPHIFSNGYQIKFSETPPPGVKIGYIVPQWVDTILPLEKIQKVYGDGTLPPTTLILPLRDDKVDDVKTQLNFIHPEIILFMSKIRKLSVRDADKDPLPESVRQISVSRETAFKSSKDEKCHSFCLHLSAEEMKENCERGYHMWRQRFPVRPEDNIEERREVKEFLVTMAFPIDDRLIRMTTRSPTTNAGIYAFLPTEMITGFPFVVQSDFILSSSRETILFDSKWNKGIINCIPLAFVKAFISFLNSHESAPSTSKLWFYKYLPVNNPRYQELVPIRDTIKKILMNHRVILCEDGVFRCPKDVVRIDREFRKLVDNANVDTAHVYGNTGLFIVHGALEEDGNGRVCDFFNVKRVSHSWYGKCLGESHLLNSFSEKQYLELLVFLSKKNEIFKAMQDVPIFMYTNSRNVLGWASVRDIFAGLTVCLCSSPDSVSWLERWGSTLGESTSYYFMPESTQGVIESLPPQEYSALVTWLIHEAKIKKLTIKGITDKVMTETKKFQPRTFFIRVAQFLYYSYKYGYLEKEDVSRYCSSLPVVGSNDDVSRRKSKTRILPFSISKLGVLMEEGEPSMRCNSEWVELSESYLEVPDCVDGLQDSEELQQVLMKDLLGAKDIPVLATPKLHIFPFLNLSACRAELLLQWVQAHPNLRGPFHENLCELKWIKTHNRGFQSPNTCLLFDANWRSQGISINDLNFISESFYDTPLSNFKEALKLLGVKVEFGEECCGLISQQLEYHTENLPIVKLYSILRRFKWKGQANIWIPSQTSGGKWKDPKDCVISDDDGLFDSKFAVLRKHYETGWLQFFQESLGVSMSPSLKDYCDLWKNWTIVGNNQNRTKFKVSCVWKKIIKHWNVSEKEIEECIKVNDAIKLPVHSNSDLNIQVKTASELLIPDDLQLQELFKSSNNICFTWYPEESDPDMPIDKLFSIYNKLGAQNISKLVSKKELKLPNSSLKRLQSGTKCLFSTGMYKLILAFLADPLLRLPCKTRHEIICDLNDYSVYETEEPLGVEYELVLEGKHLKITRQSMVRFEKNQKEIVIDMHDPNENKLLWFQMVNEFAEVVSAGLLVGHSPHVIGSLEELLKTGGFVEFEEEAINVILRTKNLRLFSEDKQFLETMIRHSWGKRFLNDFTKKWAKVPGQCLKLRKGAMGRGDEGIMKDWCNDLKEQFDTEIIKGTGNLFLKLLSINRLLDKDSEEYKSLGWAFEDINELMAQCEHDHKLIAQLKKCLNIAEDSSKEETLKVIAGATFLTSMLSD